MCHKEHFYQIWTFTWSSLLALDVYFDRSVGLLVGTWLHWATWIDYHFCYKHIGQNSIIAVYYLLCVFHYHCLSVILCCFAAGFFSTLPTVMVELNGIDKIAKSMAIWTLAIGTGCLLGTPFSGICHQECGLFADEKAVSHEVLLENCRLKRFHLFLCYPKTGW